MRGFFLGLGFNRGRANAGGGGGFDPSDLSPVAWYDFSDSTLLYTDAGVTNVTADADAIYQANDKSGNGNHLTQTTLAARPLYKTGIQNGLSVALFDGVDDFMELSTGLGTGQRNIFVTYEIVSFTGNSRVFSSTTANSMRRFLSATAPDMYQGIVLSVSANPTSPVIEQTNYNGASSKFSRNNGTPITGNVGSLTPGPGFTLASEAAGASPANLRISSVIIFDKDLTAGEESDMWNFLNNKWSIY